MTSLQRALVVDDEPVICGLVTSILEMRGYQVDVAGDGEEAVERFRQGEYELVISDIRMPQMDGLEELLHLRALNQRVPVIMMTGHGGDEERMRAERLGALFLRKPFQISLLNAVLDMLQTDAGQERDPSRLSEGTRRAIGSQDDRRRYARAPVHLQGQLRPAAQPGAGARTCRVTDIGLGGGGLQLEMETPPAKGDRVLLDVLSGDDPSLRGLAGEVAWSDGERQCGIRFADLPPEVSRRIENLVVEYLRQVMGGAQIPAAGLVG